MGKRKDLSEFDKAQIVMARRLDQSISKTAALVGCSRSAVVSIYQKCSKDNRFKPGIYDRTFKDWMNRGLTAFCIAIKNNKMKSFQELKDSFDLNNHDLFRYLQLRDYYCKEIKGISSDVVNPLIEIMCGAYQQKTNKIVSKLYRSLMENLKNTTLYVKTKWESELKIVLTEEEWYQTCRLLQTPTNSQQWREFNWKCFIRFFITPYLKSKQLGIPQDCWRDCGSRDANHAHIFWTCPKIQPFWTIVNNTLQKVLGYMIPKDCKVMFLGNITESVRKEDLYLSKILLSAARKAITKFWLKSNIPDQQQWTNIIQNIFIMEKLTYTIRLRESSFKEKWRKCSHFLARENA
ncbi:LINE-1 retrotransposable element ORF2 protein [Anabarilius grahami]|uniref:LINE-1 retrotransposable element ORF2 protein n=1 Tax=Anabarilius grahami TaxID=495550 RepID=A0A3N0Y2R6_ANAGA|nr:LINE-1 retrotransposable element ORF2 protein [Anabarilius grahami]